MCRDKYREKLGYIISLARIYSKAENKPVQVYYDIVGDKKLYNFEPINTERENIVDIINYA